MKFLYNFGMSQDDAETERRALLLQSRDRLLCIASAGEVPLNLLALSDVYIDTVDISLPQLFLTKLKLAAALYLEPQEAARFIGYKGGSEAERMRFYQHLSHHLDSSEQLFWKQHLEIFKKGTIHGARFERYLSRFNWLGLQILNKKKVMRLFEFDDVAQQQRYFDQNLNTRRLKLIFKATFHPKIYRNRGMDRSALIHSGKRDIAMFFFNKFRDFCTATPARKNYFLQIMLFNRILFDEALPEFLSHSGNQQLRKRREQMTFFHESIAAQIQKKPVGYYNKFALSNVGDWMTSKAYADLLQLIGEKAKKPARALLRYIHFAHPVPEKLRDLITADLALGGELEKIDRFPFYNLIPMSIAE